MPTGSIIDGYEPCQKLAQYVELWLAFAGDQDLLDEIGGHRLSCQVCRRNEKAVEAWRQGRVEAQRSSLFVETQGDWR